MDTNRPLRIGYAGSLAWSNGEKQEIAHSLRDYLWTYQHHVTDPSTRSAFFLFSALALAVKKSGITPSEIQIDLWGSIDKRNMNLAQELGIAEYVKIEGYLSKKDSLLRSEQCDILFLPMESPTDAGEPLFIPGKAFEYMNARKPILALADDCDCVRILHPSGLLVNFLPDKISDIADWMIDVSRNRSRLKDYNANDQYIEQYSFKNITSKLAQVFNAVLTK